ncbi:hypothetical protein ACFC58_03425 [Kitasatospora purpeofusca]|uniref:hypothetical protein n=1 Tax=Kitasatospora purpeofusca TaxID=67352 RepID=UPI0035DD2CAD
MTAEEELDEPPWVRLLRREQLARNIHGSLKASGITVPLAAVLDRRTPPARTPEPDSPTPPHTSAPSARPDGFPAAPAG